MRTISNTLVDNINREEESILSELEIEARLKKLCSDREGLRRFAESFYFIRYKFCHINFIIGGRCCSNEFLWSGLARNLYEELGGKNGVSHNQLYSDFLSHVGAKPEASLLKSELEPEFEFAQKFNLAWETFCREAPLAEALAAIAIYEIFDVPDYQLLLRVMKNVGVSQKGLCFFQVHSVANHFEMFEDIIPWIKEQENGEVSFKRAKEFVFKTQTQMWSGLIAYLQEHSLTPSKELSYSR